jgi:glycerol-3-phosphate acyltransferase PlsX
MPSFDYYGFVEGDDLGKGTVDVVVTEGFLRQYCAQDRRRNRQADRRISARRDVAHPDGADRLRLGQGRVRPLREKMDPGKVNGGVFLGLNGIVIKSHGGADIEGFAAAVDVGYDMARNGF